MKTNWIISDYHPSSKIWVYTISSTLTEEVALYIEKELNGFCATWTAHNKELRAFFKLIENRILIIGVDEHLNQASGCSIDKSIHFLEDLEKKYSIEIFNRMLFTYIDETEKLITLNRSEFEKAISENKIKPETAVVNTLVNSLNEWNTNSIVSFEKSWMKNFFGVNV